MGTAADDHRGWRVFFGIGVVAGRQGATHQQCHRNDRKHAYRFRPEFSGAETELEINFHDRSSSTAVQVVLNRLGLGGIQQDTVHFPLVVDCIEILGCVLAADVAAVVGATIAAAILAVADQSTVGVQILAGSAATAEVVGNLLRLLSRNADAVHVRDPGYFAEDHVAGRALDERFATADP